MIPEGKAFCRHCGTYFDLGERGPSHLCPDGHLENRFPLRHTVLTAKEIIITYTCGCTISSTGRWSRRLERDLIMAASDIQCINGHGMVVPMKVDPYLPLHLPGEVKT